MSALGQRSQLVQQPIHFFRGVVMCQPNAQHAAALLDPEPLRQVDSVVVAVPGEDAAFAQVRRQLSRRVAFNPNRDCRCALIKLRGIFDAVERKTGNLQQACDQPPAQLLFMPILRRSYYPDLSVSMHC